ncbi:hypothetical protein GW755_00055 [bacterium]|nr:hypothetical protein [bacterium]
MKNKKIFHLNFLFIIAILFSLPSVINAQNLGVEGLDKMGNKNGSLQNNVHVEDKSRQERLQNVEEIKNKKETRAAELQEKKNELKEKKEVASEQKLASLRLMLFDKLEKVKVRVINRADTLDSIIVRLENNILEHSSNIDSATLVSVGKKLEEAKLLINNSVSSVESLKISESYQTGEELRLDAQNVHSQILVSVEDLKSAKDLIKEALEELKSSKNLNDSGSSINQ